MNAAATSPMTMIATKAPTGPTVAEARAKSLKAPVPMIAVKAMNLLECQPISLCCDMTTHEDLPCPQDMPVHYSALVLYFKNDHIPQMSSFDC